MGQYQQWDIASGVGITALGVAAARAVESTRPDRLMEDPYAAAFVTAVPLTIPVPVRWPGDGAALSGSEALVVRTSGYIGVRSRLFDDYLRAACAGGVRQVVIVAAGLDTRAFRLNWPAGLRLFEIDQPKVLEFKDSVLAAAGARADCARSSVPVDLREDWPAALLAAGFDRSEPTAWLVEGLLPYLPAAAELALFEQISTLSAAGSQIAVECHDDLENMANQANHPAFRRLGERVGIQLAQLYNTEPRPRASMTLARAGWTCSEETAVQAAKRYDRDISTPTDPGGLVRSLLAHMGSGAFLTAQLIPPRCG